MPRTTFTLTPRGPFSLAEMANFGFGQRLQPSWDGVLRMAFCLDGYQEQVGVEVRADGAELACTLVGEADVEAVRRQVARVLSLDHDGEEFVRIGERDPVIGRLQEAAPGLRPPLFYSPYEAAAWSVLSARRPAAQMDAVRRQLATVHGRAFELAGQQLLAFPTPRQLLGVQHFPGIPPVKLARLHEVAAATLDGRLDAAQLAGMEPDDAMTQLQRLHGIGPFYASLIVIRSTGLADVLPIAEPRSLEMTARLYGLAGLPTPAQFTELAEPWRPLRTWAVVLIRAAGPRVLPPD